MRISPALREPGSVKTAQSPTGSHGGQVLLTQDVKIPVSRLRERDLTQALLRQKDNDAYRRQHADYTFS